MVRVAAGEEVHGGAWEIYERVLTPGIGWGDEARLTDDPHSADVPHITSDNCGSVHMVYESYLSAFYMLNPGTGSSGIAPVSDPASSGISPLLVTTRPNPFRGTAAGQTVAELVSGIDSEGPHSVSWDGLNSIGRPVQPGVYFIRLQIGEKAGAKPIILLR
jgi:hypothetical protein